PPQPSPVPAPGATAGPSDPWQTLRSFAEPEPPSAPTRPRGSVDPTLVSVPRGAAGPPTPRGLRPPAVAGGAAPARVAGALVGAPRSPPAPTRPGGSVDPALVSVPRGAAGPPPRGGLRPAVVGGVAALALVAGALGGVVADRFLGQGTPGPYPSALPPASVEP